jgi:Fe-S-cluster containining protein
LVDSFYLHLEFKTKSGEWSINLPFLCNKCGVCCTLDDFLTAGEIKAKAQEQPEVHAKLKALYDELGKLLEAGEAEYDDYTMHNPCPFLCNKTCMIYQIRPEGCRQFPNTAFGMQTQDCVPLTRFKKQRSALKKGRASKETYYFTGECGEPVKASKFTEKQYQNCISKLRQAGITDEELTLFHQLNEHKH